MSDYTHPGHSASHNLILGARDGALRALREFRELQRASDEQLDGTDTDGSLLHELLRFVFWSCWENGVYPGWRQAVWTLALIHTAGRPNGPWKSQVGESPNCHTAVDQLVNSLLFRARDADFRGDSFWDLSLLVRGECDQEGSVIKLLIVLPSARNCRGRNPLRGVGGECDQVARLLSTLPRQAGTNRLSPNSEPCLLCHGVRV
jgi:hypothetical protein